jgi:hypothetical protein
MVVGLLALAAEPASAAPADDERGFLTSLNQERTRAGLQALVSDAPLAGTSRTWTATMASRNQLSHDPNLAAAASSVEPSWRSIGENVGVGSDVAGLHNAFMASPGHRANVMSPRYNRVGIAVVLDSGGRLWVTMRFLEGPAIVGATGLEPPRELAPVVPIQGMSRACPESQTPGTPFTDLAGSAHAPGVTCAAWWGIATGRTATEFAPAARMTRGQLAAFLARTLEAAGVALPASPPDAFTDDDGTLHEHRINQLAQLGVVRGRTATTFAPGTWVTRAEMATFLVRTHDRAATTPLPAGVDRFWDDDTSAHEPNIDKVGQAGLAAGTSATAFAPSTPVTRGQMATFVSRLVDRFIQSGVVAPR